MPKPPSVPPYTLLILEDVAEMREWLKILISSRFSEWRVRTAASAIEFHHAIGRERPTLVLMDEVLGPGEDLASLLGIAEEELIPVALMTGMDPAHRSSARMPMTVMRRMIKPNWRDGAGAEEFLQQVAEVMALTVSHQIG